MKTGEIIRRRRRELDLTLEEIAKRVGISRQTMSRYETGVISVPLDRLVLIAEALRVSPGELLESGQINDIVMDDTIIGDDDEEMVRFFLKNQKKEHDGANQNEEFDNFTYAMHNESKALAESDKEVLLSMARQLNAARKEKDGSAHKDGENN